MRQGGCLRLLFFALQLRKQALLQVSSRYTGRVKLLDLRHDRCHLFVRHIYLLLEHQVIDQLLRRTTQVSVIVNITQYPLGDMPLRLGHVRQIDL